MHASLTMYLPLVDFIAESMGENTEVVLHDLTTLNQSVVYIRNGHISGRSVGSPITDFSLKVLKDAAFRNIPYVVNYPSVAQNGHLLKSATLFIKDAAGEPVGMLCINSDHQELLAARDTLARLIVRLNIPNQTTAVLENFTMNVQELVENSIKRICPAIETAAEKMNQKEKIEIVEQLNEQGLFMVKGAVGHAARWLRVSIPSMYRYLNAIENKKNE
ncbi:Predicted transcriptional regulator YheO, contains PAS and DNA-binding HTH domains [Dendrosporobacter quercicolus]|uniref:Predicted transcriptional regulator YheO, contains PAS and DNA-binding HTH domains n=1 Tax=Dendrosporobacter quercicolus TaxID=146817 RepID=A0A1G9YE49_9FIRM|nr:PAS domain-containing protein [Dendrosporobacter quercicolus]SDN07488.1 Predicted transcriptional regulator YheO, contains PAS and DNA-binding HTH domains [Dendrosporobacter quercicolus]